MNEKDYAKVIGANIRRIAAKCGKTQTDVCRDLGIGKSTVSTWFRGERVPRMEKVDALCKYFNVSRASLLSPTLTTDELHALDEEEVLTAYRSADARIKYAIRTMLGLKDTNPAGYSSYTKE